MKIVEKYRIECDYCDKVLEAEEINLVEKYITINSNDFGYSETEQENHYCNEKCIKGMINTYENKYDIEEYQDFPEYYKLNEYLKKKRGGQK